MDVDNQSNETSESIKVIAGQEINEGIWVDYVYDREIYQGYTTNNQGYNWVEVEVVKPIRQLICVPKSYLSRTPFHNHSWDTPFILELAKATNDKEWVDEIIKEI